MFGYQAGYSNTTGIRTTAIGRKALYANTTGNDNSALGHDALVNNTTGGSNTAIGSAALLSNTTASNNTAVGYQAAYTQSNAFAAGVTAVGYLAGYSNDTGPQLFVGGESGYATTTGESNTALGAYRTLYANTTGAYNVAVGREALRNNTTASQNTAMGYQAGFSNNIGVQNTFIGGRSGYSNTTSSDNTYLGWQAGYSRTGSGNTAVGQYAGRNGTTGVDNTLIGRNAGYKITTGSNNTVLGMYDGNQNNLDIRTLSNNIVLSDGDGVPRMHYHDAYNAWNAYGGDNALRIGMDHDVYISLADNSTVALTDAMCGATLVCVYERANGDGAVYWANYRVGTYLQQAMAVSYGFTTTSGNAGTINLYKSSASHTLTLENKTGTTLTFCVSLFGSALMKT